MRATALFDLLTAMIPDRLPLLIKGAPGTGKTDIVTWAASASKAELIVMHPVVSDPTDAKGLPCHVKIGNKDRAVFLPYGELLALMEAEELTVCFLDDLGQAAAVVQAAFMHLLLAREINGKKIADCVTFVGATNRREDKAAVTGILEPVKSRFCSIVELEANLEDWCEWALKHDVPPVLVAFNRFRKDLFASGGPATNDIVNRPSPRTITNLGKLYTCLKKKGIDSLEGIQGCAGSGYGSEFYGFVKVWESLPSFAGIVADPDGAKIPSEMSALYAIATGLAAHITPKNAGPIIRYLCRLQEEYCVLGVLDARRHCPECQETKEFINWATTHQKYLS